MRVWHSISDLLGTWVPSAFQLWLTGVINCTLLRLVVTELTAVRGAACRCWRANCEEKKRTGERSHVDFCSFEVTFCSFEVTFQCRFFTFSFPLFCSFPYSIKSQAFLVKQFIWKHFHIGIHLIRSAEGTYLHWQVGSQTTSPFSKWKANSSRTSPTLCLLTLEENQNLTNSSSRSQLFRSCRNTRTLGM